MAELTDAPTPHLLIADDDPEIGTALELFFEGEGYRVSRVDDGEEALERMFSGEAFDVVLLDVMLPGRNGFEVLREAHERGLTTPVMMVSGRGEQEARLHGLGLGARDYVVKPFEPEDLAARVRALLAAAPEPPPPSLELGDTTIDFGAREVWHGGKEVPLSGVAFDVLEHLVRFRGQPVTRRRLLREVLSLDADAMTFDVDQETIARTLERYISELRQVLEPDPFAPQYVETVYGVGYRLNA